MVDTIRCQSDLDLTEEFYEKLLLGAIDDRLDHQTMEAHSPATDGQDTARALPHRSKTTDKGKERQWSGDTVVASSSRGHSMHPNRASTMQTLYESPIDDARPKPTFETRPSNMPTPRHTSPPSSGFGPPPRHTTFSHANQEEEPEPKAARRSSTVGSYGSSWWKSHDS